ncbi:MAG: hypothetical protein HKN52_11070 [Eudoraea sp.]|nr:hypothetical protein [Eudoraea sp.]
MKTLLTILVLLFLGTTLVAQNRIDHDKVENHKMDFVLGHSPSGSLHSKEIKKSKATTVARLYRFKNTRIKKELSFSTRRNRAQVA